MYEIEKLVPIVARLAESYTSKESTSITFDQAQHLMEAVMYCIRECEQAAAFSLASEEEISAEIMYEEGIRLVEEKVKDTLIRYNEMMTFFFCYENKCLSDTVEKGLPEFFKWYDCRFDPQNTILTLDYPVLFDLSQYTGIDRIYNYVLCIQSEQIFLKKFPRELIIRILSRYNKDYRLMIDNLCEVVLTNVIVHILSGKNISDLKFSEEEYERIQMEIQGTNLSDLRIRMKHAIEAFVRDFYESDENMKKYLCKAIDNISVRIKNAADYGNIRSIC